MLASLRHVPLSCPFSVLSFRRLSKLTHEEYGPPYEVMQLKEEPDMDKDSIGPTEVLARMLMAPVNPADVNMIQVGEEELQIQMQSFHNHCILRARTPSSLPCLPWAAARAWAGWRPWARMCSACLRGIWWCPAATWRAHGARR